MNAKQKFLTVGEENCITYKNIDIHITYLKRIWSYTLYTETLAKVDNSGKK